MTKIEKNFNAINSGITDISEALKNIAECNAVKREMRQDVTHSDVETMIGSITAIADTYYMRLPVDVDGVPIRVGDNMMMEMEDVTTEVVGIGPDYYITGERLGECQLRRDGWNFANNTRHVKLRTLEDVLRDYASDYRNTLSRFDVGESSGPSPHELIDKYADEIRNLMEGR